MSNNTALHLSYGKNRQFQALLLGRAGLDLYPEPNGCKIKDALSFSSDVGGSAGNIAVAMSRAGAKAGLISALSDDAVGNFVKQRLLNEGVDTSLLRTTSGDERTSLALAEVRNSDCEVVIYRNNPADLKVECNRQIELALANSSNLVVTGTSLIDPDSRDQVLQIMSFAKGADCHVWLDLDYRAWNWPSLEYTQAVYRKAAALADVLIGNEEEFSILTHDIPSQIEQCREHKQIMVLKRGSDGSSLYAGDARLNCGIYPAKPLKPYGSGDAFLGNLLVCYMKTGDWQQSVEAGSAAASLVVSRRGCANAMPTADQIKSVQQSETMEPAANWS
jgi:5-dehydro-2-deoxygluconokinase